MAWFPSSRSASSPRWRWTAGYVLSLADPHGPHPHQDKLGHQRAYTYGRIGFGLDEGSVLYGYTYVVV